MGLWGYPSEKRKQLSKTIKRICTNLSETKYQESLIDALVRYVRAFDDSDMNSVIAKGWSAIESIVSRGENSYEHISKRIAFLYANRAFHKQIIEHLREYRNTSIHAGEYLEDASAHAYQLQRYFRQLVVFYIYSRSEFNSLDEANGFLDLPTDIDLLNRRKYFIEKAIKLLTPTPHK